MKKITLALVLILAFLTNTVMAQQDNPEKIAVTKKEMNLFLDLPKIMKEIDKEPDEEKREQKLEALLKKKYKTDTANLYAVMMKISFIASFIDEDYSDNDILEGLALFGDRNASIDEIKLIRKNHSKIKKVLETIEGTN